MAATLELVPATAGKRLGAAVLDWLAPIAVLVVTFAIGFAGITRTLSGGFIIYDTASLVLFGSIGMGLTLVYLVVLLGMEGRSGTTIGNRVMGIRSADKDGYAPGAGGVFLRGLVTGAGIILALVAAVAVVIFKWFDIALFILGPLVLVGAVWAVLVVVSNTWDANGKLRGWHDAAAKTLMFDVNAGRNPITSGGIQGPYSFAPLDLPPVQPVASPVAGAALPQRVVNQQPVNQQPVNQPVAPAAGTPTPVNQPGNAAPVQPFQWQPQAAPPQAAPAQAAAQQPPQQHPAPVQPYAAQPAPTQPYAAPQSYAPQSFSPPAANPFHVPENQTATLPVPSEGAAHPDDDLDRTQMRGGAAYAAPVAVLRIKLDDGRDFQLDRSVLVGRNPVGQAGEQQAQLLAVTDPGRSISKTHLHVLTDGAGIWVTDRNSTNGSAVTTPDGRRTPLQPGVPAFVSPGSTVHFGDRSFHLGQA
ncbi:RDD family protein [Pseudarthrobacter sulfonivorans]|uniref:RDD family protein n=1 Tax=Pseudarthrobacter sulfonivorans TaxID=121292 RepID=UPI0028645582|nr:RDD family protein [Pseudarthrobacter sulfonivorans]MDR6416169.1 putative RDD family membrane protein YckC [Pseudarthrobacter sulfonivorans]